MIVHLGYCDGESSWIFNVDDGDKLLERSIDTFFEHCSDCKDELDIDEFYIIDSDEDYLVKTG